MADLDPPHAVLMQLAQKCEIAEGVGLGAPQMEQVDGQREGRRHKPSEDGGVQELQDGAVVTLPGWGGVIALFGLDNFDDFCG